MDQSPDSLILVVTQEHIDRAILAANADDVAYRAVTTFCPLAQAAMDQLPGHNPAVGFRNIRMTQDGERVNWLLPKEAFDITRLFSPSWHKVKPTTLVVTLDRSE